MKKAFALAIFCIVVVGLVVWKKPKTNMNVVLPEKSVFFIDQGFSSEFKNNVQELMQSVYAHSKNPQDVMNQATKNFPEIGSMKVQICQSDKICFYVDASDPIFLLNNEFVVCGNSTCVFKDHFSSDIVEKLVQVSSKNHVDLSVIIDFIMALPEKIKQEFSVEWLHSYDIILHPKNSNDCRLQVSTDMVPTLQDLGSCQNIVQSAVAKSKSKKKRMMCDIRFKNQIIVR